MENTILGFDIKDFSLAKDESDMQSKREQLFEILKKAAINYPKIKKSLNDVVDTLDQGDGCFIIIDSGDFEGFINFYNKISEISKNYLLRFRGIIHRGHVNKQKNINGKSETWIGNGLNEAARFLNAEELKQLLVLNQDLHFAYGISEAFFKKASIELFFTNTDYSKYNFIVKKYSGVIYLYNNEISNFPPQKKYLYDLKITPEFCQNLKSCEFNYPDKKNNLDTFYIYPDLVHEKLSEKNTKIDSEVLINNFCLNPRNILIIGDQQYGKTALAKKIYKNIYDSRIYIPLLISCKSKEVKMFKNILKNLLLTQYGIKESGMKYESKKYIFIFDNFNNWEQNQQEKVLNEIAKLDDSYSILITDKLFFEDIEKRKLINNYEIYSISTFGHKKRYELIEKWITFVGEENTNYQSTDELNTFVDKTLINGLLPYTPFYILTILLAKKNFSSTPNNEITSKAHCYQALVYLNLKAMGIKDTQINTYLNIFSYIAYYLFDTQKTTLSEDELTNLLERYGEEYNLPFENDELIKKFQFTSIFTRNSFNQFSFLSNYSYYYFVGKYLAEHIDDRNIFLHIQEVYDNLQLSENSYIAIFIVHHTKEIEFYDQVGKNTATLFKDNHESTLSEQELDYVDKAFRELEKIIINKYDNSRQIRIEAAEAQDKIDTIEELKNNELDSNEDINKSIAEITKALRTVDVLGQIIKNHGELPRRKVIEYFNVGMNTYRRICDYFLTTFRDLKGLFLDFIQDRLTDEGSLSNADVSKYSYRLYASFNFAVIYSIIIRITESLGSKDLIKIVRTVYEEEQTPLTYCVYLQCLLWYKKEVPLDELKDKYKNFPDTVKYLIQQMLKDFTDKHKILTQDKQKIASVLNMTIKALEYDYEK